MEKEADEEAEEKATEEKSAIQVRLVLRR